MLYRSAGLKSDRLLEDRREDYRPGILPRDPVQMFDQGTPAAIDLRE
jgi:general secretion pathway protein D